MEYIQKKRSPFGLLLNNLQEIETDTVFSDRVCIIDGGTCEGLPLDRE